MYISEKLSTYKISAKINCDPKTVWYWLKRLHIPTRHRKVVPINRSVLNKLYLTDHLSIKKVGEKYDITPAAVFRKMKAINIPFRTKWEHSLLKPRKQFGGSPIEKAYLIGFRLGDLHVVRHQGRQTINISCNSTKVDQVQLIKELFDAYSHVSISKTNRIGVMSVGTALDSSFEFLLPKRDQIEKWITNNNKFLNSFIAGYTDAEGNMGVYATRAKFRLGTYDYNILKAITRYFKKQGMRAILSLDRKKGSVDKRGIRLNGDFWRITINEKSSLLKLHKMLFPLLRHNKRKTDFLRAQENILKRNGVLSDKIQI